MRDERKVVDVCVEWDDPKAYRVFLLREGDDWDNASPLEAAYGSDSLDDPLMVRLYQAAYCDNPKDFAGRDVRHDLGWEKDAPAKRAAKAVKKELKRIEAGEPGPTREQIAWAAQIGRALARRR